MGNFIMYTNFEREGWQKTLCTSNKETLEYVIKQILSYDEKVECIIKYKTELGDYPLYSFHNKVLPKQVSIDNAYQRMLSYGIK